MHHTSWHQARQLLHRAGEALTLTEEEIPLAEAVGRTLTRDARALLPVPHYDSSAMDGYATAGAPPWQVLTHPPAADGENIHRKTLPLAPGQATPILTGGLLPPGTEAVIRQEHGLREGNTLSPDPRFFVGRATPARGPTSAGRAKSSPQAAAYLLRAPALMPGISAPLPPSVSIP